MRSRRPNLYWAAFALWCCFILSFAWSVPAGASGVTQSAVDDVSHGYEIPVTNPYDGFSSPSVLNLLSATLSTKSPLDARLEAPKNKIFLSLQMSSGSVQRSFGSPLWGDFLSGMTPLPAASLRYVTASGRSYLATRINPSNQTFNSNRTNDDGMVDATYYFTVPLSNRRGSVVIAPSETMGVEYTGFVGAGPVMLRVGGPTTIPLQFPKELTVQRVAATKSPSTPGTEFAKISNFFASVLAAFLVAIGLLVRSVVKRLQRRSPKSVVDESPIQGPVPTFIDDVPPVVQPTRTARRKEVDVDVPETLRIDVLGPLTISPVHVPASDPVRAIVAFLAMNNDRVFTLDEIQTSIWPLTSNGTDIKKPAMRNYMVDVRKSIGQRHLPRASGQVGYKLCDFTTDWNEFQGLLQQAKTSARDDAVILRRQALDFAKGPPFTADTTRYFTWTFTSSVVYKMVEAVTTLAHELGTHFVLAGELRNAEGVLRQGLLSDPACLTLWQDLTDVLLEQADSSLLELHWKSANSVLAPVDVVALRERVNG